MKAMVWFVLGIVFALAISLPTMLLQPDATEAAPTQDVTITKTPCYPTKIVQLKSGAELPLKCESGCECCYVGYITDFWNMVSEGVTFMYGNNTAEVYGIAVGWDEIRTTCTTETKRYQQDYILKY